MKDDTANLSPALRRALEVCAETSERGDLSAYLNWRDRLRSLDRALQVQSIAYDRMDAVAYVRSGRKNDAQTAVDRLRLSGTAEIEKLRSLVLALPEGGMPRFQRFVLEILGPPAVAAGSRRRLSPVLLSAVATIAILVSGGIWIWKNAYHSASESSQAGDLTQLYRRMQNVTGKIVVRVHFVRKGGGVLKFPVASGTGFVVARDGLLLTNRHVVDAGPKIKARFPESVGWDLVVILPTSISKPIEGRVEHLSAYVDLATVRVQHEFSDALAFRAAPTPGKRVYAFGYPGIAEDLTKELNELDEKRQEQLLTKKIEADEEPDVLDFGSARSMELVITGGVVSAVRATEKGVMVQTDAAVHQGNSGGPLVTEEGEVVAMVTMGASTVESTNFCLAAESVFSELSKVAGIRWPKAFTTK